MNDETPLRLYLLDVVIVVPIVVAILSAVVAVIWTVTP